MAALFITTASMAQITREQYIEQYKQLAIESQEQFGIPASIKMAQALLESANGNSRLATQANNHFGIKCKSYWQGETISHDDDAPGECFRKYDSAKDSYDDHSTFLREGSRYAFLFNFPVDDYKSWAHGLKQAGYATNPQYAYRLIEIIEDNNLHLLADARAAEPIEDVDPEMMVELEQAVIRPELKYNLDDYAVYKKQKGSHTVYVNNNTRFVVMFEGETLESLANNIKVPISRLRSYNELESGQTIEPGMMVYIKAKKNKAHNGAQYHIVQKDETLYSISQLHGIKASKLLEINKKSADMALPESTRLRLR